MMKRLLLVLVLGVLLVGCGAASAPGEPTAPPDPVAGGALEVTDISMRFQWIPQWQFAGYIAAHELGYYEEAGLNVTLLGGGPEFPTKQLVASGAETFGTAWADSMYLAEEQGVPLVAVATLFQANPSAYMVHADAGIAEVADFAGRTVAVFPGGGVETEYRAMLDAAGVDRSTINEVPGEFNVEPFLSRRVDVWPVYATDQPNTVRAQGAEIDLIYARDYGVVMMGDILFTTREFIADHPNTVQAFVSASLRGWEWAVANPDEATALIAAYNTQIDPEQLAFEASETIPLVRYGVGTQCIGWNDPASWDAQEQMLLDLDLLSAPVPRERVVDNRFVTNYYAEQGVACPPAD